MLIRGCVALLVAFGHLSILPVSAHDRPTKKFDFTVTWEKHAPDGHEREMLLVNGQSPGPTIEANQGDWVVVRLCNKSKYNTTIHYHGIEMRGTPWSDGVPGVTQRSVAPGETFVYEWEASQYGSYWYHSHFHGQIEDGLYGPIVIHPSQREEKPFHMISNDTKSIKAMELAELQVWPLIINDLSHVTSDAKWEMAQAVGGEDSCYDAIVFNGKGHVRCLDVANMEAHLSDVQKGYLSAGPGYNITDKGCLPAAAIASVGDTKVNESAIPPGIFEGCMATEGSTEVFAVEQSGCGEKWIAIDVIGGINFCTGVFSIDEHDIWVYAMDGSYITPQKVQAIGVTNGDRYSGLVKITKRGDFQMRFSANSAPQIIIGNAVLRVDGGSEKESKPYIDIVGGPLSKDVVLFNQSIAAPFPPDPISQTADALYKLDMHPVGASYLWALNDTRLTPIALDSRVPTLFDPHPDIQNNVTITTKNNTWVDLVFFASTYPQPPHPIHKHSNKMYQIGAGEGHFNWTSVEDAMNDIPEQFNLKNPPRRDGFASPPSATGPAWTVIRYFSSNPGPFLIHCHVNNHMVGGMTMIIQDGVDQWPEVPPYYSSF